MKRPRISIGWLMGLVVLLGLDFGFMKWFVGGSGRLDFGVWLLPLFLGNAVPFSPETIMSLVIVQPLMLNVLVCTAVRMIRDLVHRGECGPFVSGFFLFGIVGLFVVTAGIVTFPYVFLDPLVNILGPILGPVQRGMSEEMVEMLWIVAVALILALPQLVFALVGGLLNRRFGGFKIVAVRGHGPTGAGETV
jgi:hypothetical protein